jgi:hypothetical protein
MSESSRNYKTSFYFTQPTILVRGRRIQIYAGQPDGAYSIIAAALEAHSFTWEEKSGSFCSPSPSLKQGRKELEELLAQIKQALPSLHILPYDLAATAMRLRVGTSRDRVLDPSTIVAGPINYSGPVESISPSTGLVTEYSSLDSFNKQQRSLIQYVIAGISLKSLGLYWNVLTQESDSQL